MPSPEQIIAGLASTANEWWLLALFWHVYFAALALLILRARISPPLTGILLSLPLVSVSALAWWTGNPFNRTVFLVSATALFVLALRVPRPTKAAPPMAMIAGMAMFMFGWMYPHFLNTTSLLPYLYAAPTGLIPCPTLSIIVGLTLLAGGLSGAWSLALASLAAFYGLFGTFVLGVPIDLFLAGGAATLFVHALRGIMKSRSFHKPAAE